MYPSMRRLLTFNILLIPASANLDPIQPMMNVHIKQGVEISILFWLPVMSNTVTRKANNLVLHSLGSSTTNYVKLLASSGQVQLEAANLSTLNDEYTTFISIKGDLRLNPDQDISSTASQNGLYIGKTQTNGTWRMVTNASNQLEYQRRIGGVWTTRFTIT